MRTLPVLSGVWGWLAGAAFATEPVVYLGADGQIHVIQALDDLRFEEPVAAFDVPVRVLTWKEE